MTDDLSLHLEVAALREAKSVPCRHGKHLAASRSQVAQGTTDNSQEVLELRPPGPRKPQQGPAQREVEPAFFPLVSAAHEFKTPLVVILGYADLLRSGNLGPVSPKQREVLGEIQESAERLQRLIKDLLLVGELRSCEDANVDTSGVESAVNANIEEIFDYWAPTAKQRAISYEFHPAWEEALVPVEGLKLQHIVSNLIENALRYTPGGGHVVISVNQCFWDRRKSQTGSLFGLERKTNRKINNAVCIAVSDTGPGIAPEHQEEIFLDFVQLSGASPRGTGLGLAIARRLTEVHRGAIWVASEPGKGSKFFVLLPQTREDKGKSNARAKHFDRR